MIRKKSGGNDAVGTPVPIPNTEVKHRNADDSWTETSCENMSLPDTKRIAELDARRFFFSLLSYSGKMIAGGFG